MLAKVARLPDVTTVSNPYTGFEALEIYLMRHDQPLRLSGWDAQAGTSPSGDGQRLINATDGSDR